MKFPIPTIKLSRVKTNFHVFTMKYLKGSDKVTFDLSISKIMAILGTQIQRMGTGT